MQQILSLCADPEGSAPRLRRRLDRLDASLTQAEMKAFAVNASAKARRNREARRAMDRKWRARRRRDTS